MKRILILAAVFSLLMSAVGCRKAQQTADDASQLADASPTKPSRSEIEAAKSPCEDVDDGIQAENCAKTEFEKSEAELNKLYQKILADFKNFEQKAAPEDKRLADNYNTSAANLQEAQKAWHLFRDANCKAEKENDVNEANDVFVEMSCRMRLTEDRMEDLKLIYESK